MSLLDFINPFNRVMDVVDEFVEDKDKANELKSQIKMAAEETYRQELKTKTLPWIDGLHKMGRQILSLLSIVVPAVILWKYPDIDPLQLAALAGPTGVYNYVKGKGKDS